VGTTDDPTDNLETHKNLQRENFKTQVSPSFRPDEALRPESSHFITWLRKLEGAAGISIEQYEDFLSALEKRVTYFNDIGCRSSDHGINAMFYEPVGRKEVNNIFQKILNNETLTQ